MKRQILINKSAAMTTAISTGGVTMTTSYVVEVEVEEARRLYYVARTVRSPAVLLISRRHHQVLHPSALARQQP